MEPGDTDEHPRFRAGMWRPTVMTPKEYVDQVVKDAPPLTDDQKACIVAAFTKLVGAVTP